MTKNYLTNVLEDNGFSYYEIKKYYGNLYVIKDINIIYQEPKLSYVDVCMGGCNAKFTVYINFKNTLCNERNFGFDLDLSGYRICGNTYIGKVFYNKNDFIQELQRLDSIGLNIKG